MSHDIASVTSFCNTTTTTTANTTAAATLHSVGYTVWRLFNAETEYDGQV